MYSNIRTRCTVVEIMSPVKSDNWAIGLCKFVVGSCTLAHEESSKIACWKALFNTDAGEIPVDDTST